MQHTINTKLTYGDKVWIFSPTKFQLTEVTIISLDVFISLMNVEVKYHTNDNYTFHEQLEGKEWFKTRKEALNKIYGLLKSTIDNDEEENNPHQCSCGHCENKKESLNTYIDELFDTYANEPKTPINKPKSELEQAFDDIFHQPEEEMDQDFDQAFGEFICSRPKPKDKNELDALFEELFGNI